MSFDANAFLQSQISASNSTQTIPCPAGDFTGIIDKVSARQWQSKDGSQTGVALDVFWDIEDAEVKQQLDRTQVIVKQSIMLDLTANGGIDQAKGKNVGLGRLRDAVGKNNEGEVFTFDMLPGLAAKVRVTHRVDGEDTYAEIKSVARL